METASLIEIGWTVGALIGFLFNFRVLLLSYGDRRTVESDPSIMSAQARQGLLIMANMLLRSARFLVVMLFGFLIIGFIAMLAPPRPEESQTFTTRALAQSFALLMVMLESYAIYWGWAYLRDRDILSDIASQSEVAVSDENQVG